MSTHQRTKYRWMSVSLGLSIVLLILKFTAYFLTYSTAILSDAIESIVNVIASGFAFYSIYLAGQPRDQNHPYGHGKIEFLSSGFEGAMILSAGIVIFWQAILNFFEPKVLSNLDVGLVLVGLTALANAFVGYMLIRSGKQTDSLALTADGRHLLTDTFSSIVVMIGVTLVALTGKLWIDTALSLLLSFAIVYNGFQLIRQSVARLMDETDAPTLERVTALLNVHKDRTWIDVHNLRVQKYGADLHVDCHLTLPYYWELTQVHDEVHHFEDTLKDGFQGEVEIFVHTDPCVKECCHYCRVADCPVRASAFLRDVDWTAENLPLNQKHFVPFEIANQ
ncbi:MULTISPECIES: cation diffusion facilitator family transporter [Spirosoma]|uniref:Cation diffusion facilitator family transporter n=1 Tax=Spirosoma liriopis TaxID=2937440 RepID=A0ABT0HNZ2_9BACT|nr:MULTISPECIES: cation diffusion facilitator family transporter [Spirosoma]MCK8493903.1 cation diffusion facilitator family transporter [Spirosoma liriopis]UHG93555.1 cation diffusion facilitator family transporter [Spirosoma oryzicola]